MGVAVEVMEQIDKMETDLETCEQCKLSEFGRLVQVGKLDSLRLSKFVAIAAAVSVWHALVLPVALQETHQLGLEQGQASKVNKSLPNVLSTLTDQGARM